MGLYEVHARFDGILYRDISNLGNVLFYFVVFILDSC